MKLKEIQKFKEKELEKQSDLVNSPVHYNKHGVECIKAIQASMTDEEYQGYLKGNTLKYLWRFKYKSNPTQDLEKAQWYLNKLIITVNKGGK